MTDVDDLIEKIKSYPNAQQQRNDILKLSSSICAELNRFREKIILESAEITEEKEALISKSDDFKKELAQNIIIQYLIKYFSIEENIEKEVLKEYKAELIKIARFLIRIESLSKVNYFRVIEEEIRLIKEQHKLNDKIIQELYFPKNKSEQDNAYRVIYSAPSLIPFTSPIQARQALHQLSDSVISRNELILQAQQSGNWALLKPDEAMKQKKDILAGLSDPQNSEFFKTQNGREIKQELETGIMRVDFNQRIGAWDRANEETRDNLERIRLLTSVQSLYETFKLDLLSEYKTLNKSDKSEDKAKAEDIKNKFSEMENLADILRFKQGDKYRECLAKIYDLDRPDDKGHYQLKVNYANIENNPHVKYLSVAEIEERSFLIESDLKLKPAVRAEAFDMFEFFGSESVLEQKHAPSVLQQFQVKNNVKQESEKESRDIKNFMPSYDVNSSNLIRKNNHYLRLCEKNLLLILGVPLEQDDVRVRENKVFHVLYEAHMKQNKQAPISTQDDMYLQNLAKELAMDKNGVQRIEKVTTHHSSKIDGPKKDIVNKNKNLGTQ